MNKRAILFSVSMLLVGLVFLAAYLTAATPQAIRFPALEHAHLRLQLIIGGDPVKFSDQKFQTAYSTVCTDDLSEQPIHFHDRKDQFVHLHWKGVTGGLLLKNYGWNMIGGHDDVLGYRFDRAPLLNEVPAFGSVLPEYPQNTKMWIYSGDERGYRQHSLSDFLQQDFETLLGKKSTVSAQATRGFLSDLFFARASAHNGVDHSAPAADNLTEINNMLGNIVIFAQKDKPRDDQITDRFRHLEPLPKSSCGG